jgi:hypothetical protein
LGRGLWRRASSTRPSLMRSSTSRGCARWSLGCCVQSFVSSMSTGAAGATVCCACRRPLALQQAWGQTLVLHAGWGRVWCNCCKHFRHIIAACSGVCTVMAVSAGLIEHV